MTQLARPDDHAVAFYDDAEIVSEIAAYAAEGITLGQRVLVVLTPDHRAAVDTALDGLGVDLAKARRDGSFVTLEAGHTLASFLVDGHSDPGAFRDGVGRMVAAAGEDGSTVRVFGEMVGLLWDRGDVLAALELEELWNDLAEDHRFSLLCGYASRALAGAALAEIGQICGAHARVLAPASYSAAPRPDGDGPDPVVTMWSEVFLPVPEAVAPARRFASATLGSWGGPDLAWEASLLTSELATNAVVHGRSPFRLGVLRQSGGVRIAIEDTASDWPEMRAAGLHDLDGRGMAIVEALADRCGYDAVPGGKIAWAELPDRP